MVCNCCRSEVVKVAVRGLQGIKGDRGESANEILMNPDPQQYFDFVLSGGEVDNPTPPSPPSPPTGSTDNLLDSAILGELVLG